MRCRIPKTAMSVLTLAATSALLAGCFTLEASFNINDNATVDLDYLVLFDTEQLEKIASALGEDLGDGSEMSGDALLEEFMGDEDPCADLNKDLPDFEVSTEEIREDGEVGVRCTVAGVPLAELNSLGDEESSSFTMEQDAAGTRFNAVLEGVDELTGDTADTEMITEALGVNLDDLFTVRFIVSAPGSLGDNNATSTDGSTATWDVKADADFVANGSATMTAEWTPGGGDADGSSIWIIVAIIAAVAAIAALAVVLAKRSKRPAPSDQTAGFDTPVSPTATTSPPPPPPPTAPAPTTPHPATPPPAAPPTTPPPPPPPPPS